MFLAGQAAEEEAKAALKKKSEKKKRKAADKKKRLQKSKMSFALEEDDEEGGGEVSRSSGVAHGCSQSGGEQGVSLANEKGVGREFCATSKSTLVATNELIRILKAVGDHAITVRGGRRGLTNRQ